MKMKLKQTLGSLSRAFPFSKCLHVVNNNVIKTSPILTTSLHHPLSVNTFGLFKYLTTKPTSGESPFTTAKTSVWWDIENCRVPKDCDPYKIAPNIKTALEKNNYNGALTIHAYGDTEQISSHVKRQALSSTGVSLIHVPPGVKNGSDMKIVVYMLLWAKENKAPANIMLISGDGDFAYLLNQLRLIGYNTILARPENTSARLIDASNIVWSWRSIASGSLVYEFPKKAKQSKRMDSNLVVKSKSSFRVCETCKVTCTSSVNFNSHISSKKNKKKAASLVASQSVDVKPKTMWCSICKVYYQSVCHEEHIIGRKHKNKLKVLSPSILAN